MQRAVALNKLRKLLGDKLGYRVDDDAPTPDQREAARAALKPAVEEKRQLSEKREKRMQDILAADAEYQSLCTSYKAARERVDQLSGISGRYKITVGTSSSLFFTVAAQGDSWEDVIQKIEASK